MLKRKFEKKFLIKFEFEFKIFKSKINFLLSRRTQRCQPLNNLFHWGRSRSVELYKLDEH